MFGALLMTGLFLKVLASLALFTLALSLAFGWYKWKFGSYSHFPSVSIDIKKMWLIVRGTLPENTSTIPNAILQEVIQLTKGFQTEGLGVVWFFHPYLFILGEEFMKVLVNDSSLGDKAAFYDMNALMIGNGLLGSKHELWKVHRKLLNPGFSVGVLKEEIPSFNEHGRELVQKLESDAAKPNVDALKILKQCCFKIMADSVLDLRLHNERCQSMVEDYMNTVDIGTEEVVTRLIQPWMYWDSLLPLFPSGRKYVRAAKEVTRQVHRIIKELLRAADVSEKEQQHSSEEEVRQSTGSILIQHYLRDPSFTLQDVRDHLVTLTVAGYDTVSFTLMWCFYLLGRHPKLQEKVHSEIDLVCPEGGVTFEHLSELKYLECIIKETLRLYPTVPFYGRATSKDLPCGQYTIPKGSTIVFSPFLLHRNPKIYPQPEKFDPERFTDSSKIRPWAYVPFGEGYRSCPGKRFAMMEMKILLVHVLRRFGITTLSTIDDSELEWAVVMKPVTPPRLLFHPRQSRPM